MQKPYKLIKIIQSLIFIIVVAGTPEQSKSANTRYWIESWSETAPMNTPRIGAISVVSGRFIYTAGGAISTHTNQGILDTVEYTEVKRDGSLSPWRFTKKLNGPRVFPAGIVYNGFFYLFGGESGLKDEEMLMTVERAPILPDGGLGDWIIEPLTMNTPRRAPVVSILGKRVYVSGGFNGKFLTDVVSAKINVDGSLNDWRNESSDTKFERYIHSGVVLRDTIYVFGGHSTKPGGAFDAVEWTRVNPEDGYLNLWSMGPTMSTKRYLNGAILHNDSVYLIGGRNTVVLTSVEKINLPKGSEKRLDTLAWKQETPINEPREGLSVALVGDNLYAIGGRSYADILASVERAIIRPDKNLGHWADMPEKKKKDKPDVSADAISHFTLGAELNKKGNPSKAVIEFMEGLRLAPGIAEGYNLLGEAYLNSKDLLSARDVFLKALKIKDGYTPARFNLGMTYYQLKKYKAAIREYKMVVEHVPENLAVRQNLAVTYLDTGQYKKAVSLFEYIIDKDPANIMIKGFLKFAKEKAKETRANP